MGGGNPLKKVVKEVKRVAKDPVKAIAATSTMGIGTGLAGAAEREATGGVITEAVTGGLVKSKQTKAMEAAASKAERKQEAVVKEISAETDRVAKMRDKRRAQQALGKRSLLWQGAAGSELGVQKKQTLG